MNIRSHRGQTSSAVWVVLPLVIALSYGVLASASSASSRSGAAVLTPQSVLGLGVTTFDLDLSARQARGVAVEFFRSQNERRYDDLCALFSRGFIRAHALRDRRTCAAVSRVEFVWSLKIEFRIGKVVHEGDRLVVQAVADGAPGRIVLMREDGSLKILAVEGG